jgi:hypothetical protein
MYEYNNRKALSKLKWMLSIRFDFIDTGKKGLENISWILCWLHFLNQIITKILIGVLFIIHGRKLWFIECVEWSNSCFKITNISNNPSPLICPQVTQHGRCASSKYRCLAQCSSLHSLDTHSLCIDGEGTQEKMACISGCHGVQPHGLGTYPSPLPMVSQHSLGSVKVNVTIALLSACWAFTFHTSWCLMVIQVFAAW